MLILKDSDKLTPMPYPRPKTIVKLALSLLVLVATLLTLYYFGGISYREVWAAVQRFSAGALIAIFFCILLQNVFGILRLRSLFKSPISLLRVAHAVTYGQLVNTFIPARAGDFLKIVLLKPPPESSDGVSPMIGTGVILADKLVDIAALMLLILFSQSYLTPNFPFHLPSIKSVWLWTDVVLTIGLFIFFLKKKSDWMDKFKNGLSGLTDPKRLFLSLGIGMGAWAFEAFAVRIFGVVQGYDISFSNGVLVLAILNLAIAIPLSVANVGTFEGSLAFAFKLLGLPLNIGTAIAAVHHFLQMMAVSTCASVVFIFLRFKKISSARSPSPSAG